MTDNKDPLGQAILDYSKNQNTEDIIVSSDLCEDDVIPVSYLFRSYKEMPKLEQQALALCEGEILDAGAGAGIHTQYLIEQGKSVTAIDISNGAVDYLRSKGVNAKNISFLDLKDCQFDTILMLMNGIGIAGSDERLPSFLAHAKTLLKPGGKIVLDSTDIIYMYEDEDGSLWMDLNTTYYGNFKFQMKYKDAVTDWFEWLYIDQNKLAEIANANGFNFEIVSEEDYTYLAVLKLNE